jgi:hypothetical protein
MPDELEEPEEHAGAAVRDGGRAKLAANVLDDLAADWRAYGVETIARVREEKPDQYLKIFVAVLPRQTESEENREDEFTYDELCKLRALLGGGAGGPQA